MKKYKTLKNLIVIINKELDYKGDRISELERETKELRNKLLAMNEYQAKFEQDTRDLLEKIVDDVDTVVSIITGDFNAKN